jgi:hypothetical protein
MNLMEKMAELGKSMLTSDVEFRQIRTTLVELNHTSLDKSREQ